MSIDPDAWYPILVFSIPICVLVAWFTRRIIVTVARHRALELAYRARIAALERGFEPPGR